MLTKEEFARRLKFIIDQRNMKQADLAKDIGVSPANISNYVLGKAFPPVDTLAEIAKKLSVSLDELCGIENEEQHFEPKTAGDVAQLIMRILEAIPNQCELETIAMTEDQRTDEYPYYEKVETSIPAISFGAGDLRVFVTDLMKMRKLLEEETFDCEFYKRWLNDRIQALNKVPLYVTPEFPTLNNDYYDGELPF